MTNYYLKPWEPHTRPNCVEVWFRTGHGKSLRPEYYPALRHSLDLGGKGWFSAMTDTGAPIMFRLRDVSCIVANTNASTEKDRMSSRERRRRVRSEDMVDQEEGQ